MDRRVNNIMFFYGRHEGSAIVDNQNGKLRDESHFARLGPGHVYVKTGSLRRALDWEDQHFSIAIRYFVRTTSFVLRRCHRYVILEGVNSARFGLNRLLRHRHLGLRRGAFRSRRDEGARHFAFSGTADTPRSCHDLNDSACAFRCATLFNSTVT